MGNYLAFFVCTDIHIESISIENEKLNRFVIFAPVKSVLIDEFQINEFTKLDRNEFTGLLE